MSLNLAGGLRAATAFMDETARQEDRAYQREQRDFQREQQVRQREDWKRADTLRKDLSSITDTQQVAVEQPVTRDDDGNAMPAAMKTEKVLPDVQLRRAAAAYGKAGDFGKAIELHQQADKIGWDRSTKMFMDLQTQAQDPAMDAAAVAAQAAKIYGNDPFAGKVTDVKPDGNGGVTITATNRETGQSNTRTYANKQALLESLHAYYSPQTFAALQAKRQEALIKLQEKQAEPMKVSPGQAVVQNGRVVYQAPQPAGYEYIGDDAQGNPTYRKIAAGGGTGTGTGTGGKNGVPPDASAAVKSALEAVTKLKTAEMTEDQFLAANENAQRIVTINPKVPPEVAAKVAVAAAKDPSKVKPAINPETGKVDLVYRDGANGRIALHRGVASADDLENLTLESLGVDPVKAAKMTPEEATKAKRDGLRRMTDAMLGDLPTKDSEAIREAAWDSKAQDRLEASLRAQAELVLEERTAGKSPEQVALARARLEEFLEQKLAALRNTLDLVRTYGTKPPRMSAGSFRAVGGIRAAAEIAPAPGSYAARGRERIAQQERQKTEAETARQARKPEVQQRVKQLLAAGDKRELYKLQGSDDFELLDRETQLQIHGYLNSGRR